jgi:NTE family protein
MNPISFANRLKNLFQKPGKGKEIQKKVPRKATLSKAPFNIGIALSGGSAHGLAHIGVLKALEKYDLAPQIISGTSMGALIGVLYAAGHSPDHILDLVKNERIYNLITFKLGKNGLLKLDAIMRILKEEISADSFSVLEKPFFLSVANISEGKNEVISEGSLFEYVMASISIPIIFMPQKIDGKTYVDGGLYDNLPARSIRDKCQTLIGVNVNFHEAVYEFNGIREIFQRIFNLGIEQNVATSRPLCDFLIEPNDIKNYSLWDFDKVDELVELGFTTAEKVIKESILPSLKKD